jgi:diacylglycerol O-acyltransferase
MTATTAATRSPRRTGALRDADAPVAAPASVETTESFAGVLPMTADPRRRRMDNVSTHSMSHADAAWLRMDSPTNLMVINSLLFFETTPDWDRLRANHVERIVERFPRFRQIAHPGGALNGAHWEDDPQFDPDDHFHRLALPAPADLETLKALVGDLVTAPLDHGRPLWEVHLIEGVGDGAVLLTRVHHAVADGIALARVMLSATDGGDPGPGVGGDGHRTSAFGALLHGGISAVAHPRRAATRGLADAGTLTKLLWPGGEDSRVLKGDGHVGHHVAWSTPVELWRVKHTADAYRVTVNDVLMAALAGALRARILAAGAEPERLHALVPLNLRPLDEPVSADLGNHFGLVLADLPVDMGDPVDRLWEVNRRMDAIKRSDEGAISYGILDLMGRAPTEVETRLLEYFTSKASMVVTNVRGPQRTISLAGTPVAGTLVWAPCSGDMRMTVSIFSYAGKVTVGFLTDAGIMPDPQPLADTFRRELLDLAHRSRNIAR